VVNGGALMQTWFGQVGKKDTKIWVALYIIVGIVLAYFSTIVYPLSVLLAQMPGRVKFMLFIASILGLVLRLFIFTYVGYLVYLLLCSVLHEARADKTATKRSLYLAVCISSVIVDLLQLVAIIVTAGNISQILSIVLTGLNAVMLAYLSAHFFAQRLHKVHLGRALAVVLFILGLVPIGLNLLLPQ
jgi:hypothetical protein